MKPLTSPERRALRAKAHHLDPVVMVGQHGVTAAVLHELDLALLKHELVKVRVASDDRDVRAAALAELCAAMDCAPVQHLGKVLVLWRPNPDKKAKVAPVEAKAVRAAARGARKKSGPRAPVDPVRERRRRTREDTGAPASGKGRRGAARHMPAGTELPEAEPAPAVRRKSTFTPKTKPKSFSAKPNPRSAWEKAPPEPRAKPRAGAKASATGKAAGTGKPAGPRKPAAKPGSPATRRRRTAT